MAANTIDKLSFTKDWTNPEDFPTVASDAVQARANIQRLHDETRDYLNTVMNPVVQEAMAMAQSASDKADDALAAAGGTVTVGPTAPTATTGLWVDTGDSCIIKYYDSAARAWKPCAAVWK